MPDTPNLRPATQTSSRNPYPSPSGSADGSACTTRTRRWHGSPPSGWSSTWSGRDTWSCTSRRLASMGHRGTSLVGLRRPRGRTGTSSSPRVMTLRDMGPDYRAASHANRFRPIASCHADAPYFEGAAMSRSVGAPAACICRTIGSTFRREGVHRRPVGVGAFDAGGDRRPDCRAHVSRRDTERPATRGSGRGRAG